MKIFETDTKRKERTELLLLVNMCQIPAERRDDDNQQYNKISVQLKDIDDGPCANFLVGLREQF